jgi:hypothetical protein
VAKKDKDEELIIDPDMMVDLDANIFNPNDKVKQMGKKERIPAYLLVDPYDPSILYIRTNGKIEILDNSIYEVVIKDLEFEDGDMIQKESYEFVTDITPCYGEVDEILTVLKGIRLDPKDILMHIRSASEIVEYWAYKHGDITVKLTKENVKENYYPFYHFVEYKAAAEALKQFYIQAIANPYKFHDVLSDLEREQEMDLDAIRELMDALEAEADEWLELVVNITADPKWALRSKYSYAVSLEMMRPYHKTYIDRKGGGNGWNRGY